MVSRVTAVKSRARGACCPWSTVRVALAAAGAADVLAAARAGEVNEEQRKRQLFYAHLYLGLFYEASGNGKLARKHITEAAEHYKVDDYMGEVARVHAEAKRKTGN